MIFLLDFRGKCAPNQSGPFCYTCSKGYARVYSKGICLPCDTSSLMYLKVFSAFAAIFIYITLQMQFIFKMNTKGHSGILIKQIINHFQQIGTLSVLDLGWTKEIKDYFSTQEYFSFASEEFVSFDCMFDEINSNLLTKRIIISTISPFALTGLCVIGWNLLLLIKKILKKEIPKDYLSSRNRASFIISGYLLFPEILRKSVSFMNCVPIDDTSGVTVVLTSPDVECWKAEHINLLLYSSLPGILIWGLLAPLVTWIYLKLNRNTILKKERTLKEKNWLVKIEAERQKDHGGAPIDKQATARMVKKIEFKQNYFAAPASPANAYQNRIDRLAYNMLHFFYKGLKADFYYWEILMFFKKILIILIASFTEFFPPGIKATLLLIILTVFILLQTRKNPFESDQLNRIEFSSLIVTFLTANVGIMLLSEELRFLSKFFLVFVIVANAWFFAVWLRTFLRVLCRRRRGTIKK